MKNITIICPTCEKKGTIEVSEHAMKGVTRGLLAVNIAEGMICEHIFIIYLDLNMEVRDYFIADFHVEIPEISLKERESINKIPSKDIIDMDLIKLNMHAMLLTKIIKSILCRQKILIISAQEFLYKHILNFFDYITQDAFEVNITFVKDGDYKKNKKLYKDHMIFDSNSLIKNNKKIINHKKLEIEKQIITKFLTHGELGFSYIFLKNEIFKAFKLSKSIVEFIKDEKENGNKVNILIINKSLEDSYQIKINPIYLNFLISIVKGYFNISVPDITTSFLGLL